MGRGLARCLSSSPKLEIAKNILALRNLAAVSEALTRHAEAELATGTE